MPSLGGARWKVQCCDHAEPSSVTAVGPQEHRNTAQEYIRNMGMAACWGDQGNSHFLAVLQLHNAILAQMTLSGLLSNIHF